MLLLQPPNGKMYLRVQTVKGAWNGLEGGPEGFKNSNSFVGETLDTVGTVTIGTIVLKNLWKASIEIIESSENWHLRTPTFEDVGCWALIFREDCHSVIVCGQTQVLHVVHVVDYTTYILLHSGISQLWMVIRNTFYNSSLSKVDLGIISQVHNSHF